MTWDPQRYLNFVGPRLRPALDLLSRVDLEAPKSVVDLGCGPGNVTPYLCQRWPKAQVFGVDRSPEMLTSARASMPDQHWIEADAATWQPTTPADLIYSNAALHWLPDHDQLFPRLLSLLAPGGVLAVQMPRNFSRPTHQLVYEAAQQSGVYTYIKHLFRPPPTHPPEVYYEALADHCAALDIWETNYIQVLSGDNPVAEWTAGSWLRPFTNALDEPDRSRFVTCYRNLIRQAYPARNNGHTLLPYLRLFLIAKVATL